MPSLTIELPKQSEQTAFNLRRWTEILRDREFASVPGRIETDRHGHVIMSPPPSASHGRFEFRIGALLEQLMSGGEAITECPISTADGVRSADVAWASDNSLEALGEKVCFGRAPEICVEVMSPGNIEAEIQEKMSLYFDAGAREAWICSSKGSLRFFHQGERAPRGESRLCPEFPKQLRLRKR